MAKTFHIAADCKPEEHLSESEMQKILETDVHDIGVCDKILTEAVV